MIELATLKLDPQKLSREVKCLFGDLAGGRRRQTLILYLRRNKALYLLWFLGSGSAAGTNVIAFHYRTCRRWFFCTFGFADENAALIE
jgi:hypothetical protein